MNLCDIKTVKKIMAEFGTGTKKAFGQNFLINPDVPFNIAEESYSYHKSKHPDLESGVIEIGPGIGSLTYELGLRYNKAVAIEIDKTLIPILDKTLGELDNVSVINDDFLKLDTVKLINDNFGNIPVSVCANLPYYITTPIIMKLLEESRENGKNRLTSITVMVQKEVADRLCATEKDKDYGAITASINYYGTVKKLFDVGPDNFLPPPKVTSSVVRIELYDEPKYTVKSEKMLFRVIEVIGTVDGYAYVRENGDPVMTTVEDVNSAGEIVEREVVLYGALGLYDRMITAGTGMYHGLIID